MYFEKSYFRQGFLSALYDEKGLINELKNVYRATTTLDSTELKTGLLIVIKRLDSGSPWMYATLNGYRVGWPMGADKILLLSVGTGLRNPSVTPSSITVGHAVQALLAFFDG